MKPKEKPIKTRCDDFELNLIAQLQRGQITYRPGRNWDKRFIGSLKDLKELSDCQREQLFRIAWTYRKQIDCDIDLLINLYKPIKDKESRRVENRK